MKQCDPNNGEKSRNKRKINPFKGSENGYVASPCGNMKNFLRDSRQHENFICAPYILLKK